MSEHEGATVARVELGRQPRAVSADEGAVRRERPRFGRELRAHRCEAPLALGAGRGGCARRGVEQRRQRSPLEALTAVRGALGRRSRLCRPRNHIADGAATVVPQRGPRGGLNLRSGVDHRMVEAPEPARDDNARRDRIALCGADAVSAAHHHA